MSRELPSYRDNLERVNELFPNIELLTRKEIEACTGITRKTVLKEFPFTGKYISKVNFARMLAMKGAN